MRCASMPREALGQRIDARSVKASSTTESAAANGQFSVSRTCCSISTAIIITRPPPSKAGVMKKPSDSTKTSIEPAKMPFSVSGT